MRMMAFQLIGLASLVYAAIFFAISFFVLLVVRKLEKGGFRYFGLAVVAILWSSALLILTVGFQVISTRSPMMMHGMRMHRPSMSQQATPGVAKLQQNPNTKTTIPEAQK